MLEPASFQALGLSDAVLKSIEWKSEGRDLSIRLTHASGQELELICSWAHERKIALGTPPQHGGYPLVWKAILAAAGQEFRLHLDFASGGAITFLCSGVSLGPQA